MGTDLIFDLAGSRARRSSFHCSPQYMYQGATITSPEQSLACEDALQISLLRKMSLCPHNALVLHSFTSEEQAGSGFDYTNNVIATTSTYSLTSNIAIIYIAHFYSLLKLYNIPHNRSKNLRPDHFTSPAAQPTTTEPLSHTKHSSAFQAINISSKSQKAP